MSPVLSPGADTWRPAEQRAGRPGVPEGVTELLDHPTLGLADIQTLFAVKINLLVFKLFLLSQLLLTAKIILTDDFALGPFGGLWSL